MMLLKNRYMYTVKHCCCGCWCSIRKHVSHSDNCWQNQHSS